MWLLAGFIQLIHREDFKETRIPSRICDRRHNNLRYVIGTRFDGINDNWKVLKLSNNGK